VLPSGYPTDDWAVGVRASGNLVYLVNWSCTVRSFDATNPSQLVQIGSYTIGDYMYALAFSDNLAFATNWHTGLYVIDESNPRAPKQVASWPMTAFGVFAANNIVYVGGGQEGLLIFQITHVKE